VKESADLMAPRGFIALPVVDVDGDLIGRETEADLVWHRSPRGPRY
jgi:CBS domain-containing protein